MLNQTTYQNPNHQNLSKPIYQSNQTNQNQINQNHQTQSTKSKTYRHPDFPELELVEELSSGLKVYAISHKDLPAEIQELWREYDKVLRIYLLSGLEEHPDRLLKVIEANPDIAKSLVKVIRLGLDNLWHIIYQKLLDIYPKDYLYEIV